MNEKYGVNINSAKIMITVYGKMVRGLAFKRALSVPDMRYYLARFMSEGDFKFSPSPSRHCGNILLTIKRNSVTLKPLRNLHSSYLAIVNGISDLAGLNESFDEAVEKALNLPEDQRRKHIFKKSLIPKAKPVVVYVYERNPLVVAKVIAGAKGVCERYETSAPFKRKKMEIHTWKFTIKYGFPIVERTEDTVNNAVALCPHCHQDSHFGEHNKRLW